MPRYTVDELDAEWRRRCRQDETLSRVEPPGDARSLVEGVLRRVRPGSDYPEHLLANHASGFGAAHWQLPLRIVLLQVCYLVEVSSWDEDARSDLSWQAQRVVCAQVADAASGAYRKQAETDPLTELGNRRMYEERIENRSTQVPRLLSAASIDLDGLKSINDKDGHAAGDDYLRGFANALQRFATEKSCDVFRFGGDEFALLTTELSAEELSRDLAYFRRQDSPAAFSFGVSEADDPDDFSSLMQIADARLYEEKSQRKDE